MTTGPESVGGAPRRRQFAATTTAACLAAQATAATKPMPSRPGATQTMPERSRDHGH